jgi:hypothetical protein
LDTLGGLHPDAWLVELEVLSPLHTIDPGEQADFAIMWEARGREQLAPAVTTHLGQKLQGVLHVRQKQLQGLPSLMFSGAAALTAFCPGPKFSGTAVSRDVQYHSRSHEMA